MSTLTYPHFEEKLIESFSKFIQNKGGNDFLHRDLVSDLISHLNEIVKNLEKILSRTGESNIIVLLDFLEFLFSDDFYTLLLKGLNEKPIELWTKEDRSIFLHLMELELFKVYHYNDLALRMKEEGSVIGNFSFFLTFEERRDKSLKRMTAFKIWLSKRPQLSKELEDCLKFLNESGIS